MNPLWSKKKITKPVKRAIKVRRNGTVKKIKWGLIADAAAELADGDTKREHIARAAMLDRLGEMCHEQASTEIMQAREHGATWDEVARGAGYSRSQTAASRYRRFRGITQGD